MCIFIVMVLFSPLVYLNVCGVNPKDHGIKQELVSLHLNSQNLIIHIGSAHVILIHFIGTVLPEPSLLSKNTGYQNETFYLDSRFNHKNEVV